MELFTMGIGNYTQDDVHYGALALSGWVDSRWQGRLSYPAGLQGHGDVSGPDWPVGPERCREACLRASHHCRSISPGACGASSSRTTPPDSDLKPLVDAYNNNDHSISAMVKAMLTSSAFFSEKAYRARVKSPAEFVIGALRGWA